MKSKDITFWLIVSTVAIWIGWDIYAICNGVPGDTISEIITEAGKRYQIIAVVWGMLGSHWFW